MADEVVQEEAPEATLRDTLESAFEEVIESPASATPAPTEAAAAAVPAEAPADTRVRNEDGTFAKAPPAKPAAKPAAAPAAAPNGAAAPAAPIAPSALARPSSWKKDLDGQWKALPPDVQKYVLQREGEFANGVSTYKKEWDAVKPLQDAIAPYKSLLDQHKIDPAAHVGELLRAHHTLVMGTQQQKAALVARICQQNQIPLEQLLVRDAEGRLYFNPNLAQQQHAQQPQPAQAQQPQQDVRATVQQILTQEKAQQSLAEFEAVAAQKYPHYESVREDMALLLESGKAQDLASAYEKALRLNDELWQAEQASKQTATEAERQKQAAEAAARARRNAVSTRSATPAGKPAGKGDNKGLRAQLEEAFDEHVGGARV